MNDDSQLEAALRSMRPGKLPADLRTRMAEPPPAAGPRLWKRPLAILPLAAAAVWLLWPGLAPPPATPAAPPPTLTLHEQRSTLIDSRPLKFIEHDGQLWEIAEETWREEELALCSTSPLQVQTTETTRQIVCQPVHFD